MHVHVMCMMHLSIDIINIGLQLRIYSNTIMAVSDIVLELCLPMD